jgi:hypothetical protein
MPSRSTSGELGSLRGVERPIRLGPADRPTSGVHVCFRIVRTDPPSVKDFQSYTAMGRTPRNPTPKALREYAGVSVYDTEEHARDNALRNPGIGQFLARLEIPNNAPIEITPVSNLWTGHHNLYGTPEAMLACVVPPLLTIAAR